jgi:hypothetical protein
MGLKLVRDRLTLVYGMKLFAGAAEEGGPHAHVPVTAPDGSSDDMALHTIVGDKEEIRAQLLQSIDAFFELMEPVGS